ncbi:MAG: hypothetical protein P8Z79_04895 [Sedimentisphaerales bacterium]
MSKKISPKDVGAREMVKHFCQYVVGLKAIHYIGKELFANDEGRKLMEQTAVSFFTDMNGILVKYFILEIAKITDPAVTKNTYENFTIANLLETINWPESVAHDLARLNRVIKDFRKRIKGARDKLLAHYDKNTFMSGTVLGTFPEGDDDKFMEALEEMCNVLHKASFGSIFGDIVVGMPGDVLDLKKTLKRAIAFNKLFKESSGEAKLRLFKYLNA